MQVLLLQFIFLVFNLDASMSSSKTLSTDQVKIWAETLGITNLSEDAAEFISSAVSQKVHAIVDRASKTANSSCRMKILKSDVESAMQFLNLEPTVDISTGDYIPIRGVSGVGGRTLYVIDDKDKDLFSITKRHSGPVPPDVVLRQHWLAVEGKQPAVPENPAPISKDEQKSRASNPAIARKVATERAIRKSQMIGIKDLATSDLTAEQQQYYKDITEAVIGSDENKRREALSSLEHDPGLHALVARIAVFISEGVKVNVVQQNLALLIYIMRMVKACLDNQSLYLQPYLHLIIPAVSSCVVSKMLCSRPETDNHWALRGFAARILASISKAYDSPTNRISQRLIQILQDVLDKDMAALATRFGAYSALVELGNETVSMMVLPRLKHEGEFLKACSDNIEERIRVHEADSDANKKAAADKKAVEQIKERLVIRVAEYQRVIRPSMDKPEDFRTEFGPVFGPAIYEQIQKERMKDAAKRPTMTTPMRMISPQTSVASYTGSPGQRMPVPSPASSLVAPSPAPSIIPPSPASSLIPPSPMALMIPPSPISSGLTGGGGLSTPSPLPGMSPPMLPSKPSYPYQVMRIASPGSAGGGGIPRMPVPSPVPLPAVVAVGTPVVRTGDEDSSEPKREEAGSASTSVHSG